MGENIKYVKPFIKFLMKDKEPVMFLASAIIWIVDAFLLIENKKILSSPFFVIILCGLVGWIVQYLILYSAFSLNKTTDEQKMESAYNASIFSFMLLILFSVICFISRDSFKGLLFYTCGGAIIHFLFTMREKNKAVKKAQRIN